MMTARWVFVSLLLLLFPPLISCSSTAWYNGFQAQQRKTCLDVPSSEYVECLERANRSYQQYHREREERLARP
jgi:hypothetical protein